MGPFHTETTWGRTRVNHTQVEKMCESEAAGPATLGGLGG